MVTFSLVNSTADITCKASFLAPCGVICPFRGFPPIISKEFLVIVIYFFSIAEASILLLPMRVLVNIVCWYCFSFCCVRSTGSGLLYSNLNCRYYYSCLSYFVWYAVGCFLEEGFYIPS